MFNNSTTLPAQYSEIVKAVNVPEAIREGWKDIKPAIFNKERGVLCYAITTGAWQNIYPQTIPEALAMQAPSLGAVLLYTGHENTVQLLAEMITTASLLVNAGKNIRAEQIYPTAMLLVNNPEYRLFTVADLRLALNRGVMGKYGQVFDRFDISVLSSWLNAYWEERLEEAERLSEISHSQTKAAPKPDADTPKAPEWFSKFVQEFTARTEGPRKLETHFEPDDLILAVWKEDWLAIPEGNRPKFENYCKLQKIRMQTGRI